jgi:hypothetical protein
LLESEIQTQMLSVKGGYMKRVLLFALIALWALSSAALAEESTSESDGTEASETAVVEETVLAEDIEYGGYTVEELVRIIQEQAGHIEDLTARVGALEGNVAQVSEKAEKAGELPSWVPKVKISGDLRYRFEHISEAGKKSRQRDRIRARLGMSGKVNDQVDFKVRLASGSDDPVSTNQTLDGAFSSKDIWFDQAFFDWHPNENVNIYGGKMSNPFFVAGGNQLLWDGDLTPEGLALSFHGSGENQPFFNVAHFWADERGGGSDARMLGLQGGVKFGGKSTTATVGLGYYNFTSLKGESPLFDATDSFGNSVTTDPNTGDIFYANGFKELEAFAQVDWQAGNTPVSLYGNWVTNTDAGADDTGWLVGFDLGSTKEPGNWKFGYNYRRVEADAVLGAWCDSDFAGGGTDGKGHIFSISTLLAKNATFGVTYLVNDAGLVNGKDYKRLQVDFGFKF